ncbi:MAG TPA: MerR family transcriptional regulator [Candidatus Eremiobacteraeota bacterium]|nr:MAG: putative heat shock protein HspR [bacterium ADurb.Bin363]HPZ09972.1 MerR family transcriptional regulator [Candidatus Eremiobacteraeota bacterium]
MWKPKPEEPCYTMKVVSDLLELHPQTIRNYEKLGFIKPLRTEGNMRLFSSRDMEYLKEIVTYRNMGINLAGIEVIIKLLRQVEELKEQLEYYKKTVSESVDLYSIPDTSKV